MADQMFALRRGLNAAKTGTNEEVVAVSRQASDLAAKMTAAVALKGSEKVLDETKVAAVEEPKEKEAVAEAQPAEPEAVAAVEEPVEEVKVAKEVAGKAQEKPKVNMEDLMAELKKNDSAELDVEPAVTAREQLSKIIAKAIGKDEREVNTFLADAKLMENIIVRPEDGKRVQQISMAIPANRGIIQDYIKQYADISGTEVATHFDKEKFAEPTIDRRKKIPGKYEAVTPEKSETAVAAAEPLEEALDAETPEGKLPNEVTVPVPKMRNMALARTAAQNRAINQLKKEIAKALGKESIVGITLKGIRQPQFEQREGKLVAVIKLNNALKKSLIEAQMKVAAKPETVKPKPEGITEIAAVPVESTQGTASDEGITEITAVPIGGHETETEEEPFEEIRAKQIASVDPSEMDEL